jgi:type II secretory pathway pseudopilin PulG
MLFKPTPWIQEQALRWLGWLPKPCHRRIALGFTLAELLISLLILAEIATFTIPKIITGQQNGSYNTKVKEAAAMVTGAYQRYQNEVGATAATGIQDLTPYMNYVAANITTIVDDKQTLGTYTCASVPAAQCLRLHSGAILRYGTSAGYYFGGTNTTNAIWFDIDPDGTTDGTTNGPGKAVEFWMYYNGRLSTFGTIASNTCYNGGCANPTPTLDPPWFSW